MANDLATLTAQLGAQLSDAGNTVWSTAVKQDVLTWACDDLFSTRPRVVRDTIVCVADQDQYTLPSVQSVVRVDILDNNAKLIMPLPGGTWEVWGDGESPSATLYVNPNFSKAGWSFRVHGYSSYDLVTNLPPTRIVPLILAVARAEALRRMVSQRAKFEQYANSNPRSNTSVNEVLSMVREAETEADRLRRSLRMIMRPRPARV